MHPSPVAPLPRLGLQQMSTHTDVDVEFDDILEAARAARRAQHNPWRSLFSRRFTPQLVVLVALQVFNQMDGINTIMFYGERLSCFRSLAEVLFESCSLQTVCETLAELLAGRVPDIWDEVWLSAAFLLSHLVSTCMRCMLCVLVCVHSPSAVQCDGQQQAAGAADSRHHWSCERGHNAGGCLHSRQHRQVGACVAAPNS